jgi:hypothetical protein
MACPGGVAGSGASGGVTNLAVIFSTPAELPDHGRGCRCSLLDRDGGTATTNVLLLRAISGEPANATQSEI